MTAFYQSLSSWYFVPQGVATPFFRFEVAWELYATGWSTWLCTYVIKPIVVTHRENGRRDGRRYSRMKYLLDRWGIDKFRAEVKKILWKGWSPQIWQLGSIPPIAVSGQISSNLISTLFPLLSLSHVQDFFWNGWCYLLLSDPRLNWMKLFLALHFFI